MRTCTPCGFENAEEDKACPLCGASVVTKAAGDTEAAPTLAYPSGHVPSGEGTGLKAGQLFGGRYRVDSLLGRGGMGHVYRAVDVQSDSVVVALKVIRPGNEDDPSSVDRFRREIGLLSKIRHPAVLRVHDWGVLDGQVYFASELVEGLDLKTAIQQRGAWEPLEAAALTATLADALAAAHAQGVVHRDVKPNNVMLAGDGSVRLLDFGLARGAPGDMTSLTKTGMIVGTPGYMSPEQFEGRAVDARTDLYSLGVVLFELLTGRLPFMATTPIALALKHRSEAAPSPRVVRPEVPGWLERVCLKCLEKDPDQRFPTATALAEELRRPHAERTRRRLPSGDMLVEDDTWALALQSRAEKKGWAPGMALSYGGQYYKLAEVRPPAAAGGSWTYTFRSWPEVEVFRRLVDYEEDCAQRAAEPEGNLKDRLGRWLRGS